VFQLFVLYVSSVLLWMLSVRGTVAGSRRRPSPRGDGGGAGGARGGGRGEAVAEVVADGIAAAAPRRWRSSGEAGHR
jgi:hypothetical protein